LKNVYLKIKSVSSIKRQKRLYQKLFLTTKGTKVRY